MSLKKGLKGPWRNRNVRFILIFLLDSERPKMQVPGMCYSFLRLDSILIQAAVFGQNIKVIQGSRHAGLDPASSQIIACPGLDSESAQRAGLILLDTGRFELHVQ